MNPHPSLTPFQFVGCVELREMLGRKAADLQQLMGPGCEGLLLASLLQPSTRPELR